MESRLEMKIARAATRRFAGRGLKSKEWLPSPTAFHSSARNSKLAVL
ncbi:unnamed protein product [Linum tenue]|uniref:Uncharacterized protein n=1 Tax=Linum tenue TaxID=586396 RepID=A0AAV0N2J5_9ROSI|nr:unnamed protein product [Linum tenue]